MMIGRILITATLYPRAYFFGLSFAHYEELEAYAIGVGFGAGAILIGIKD